MKHLLNIKLILVLITFFLSNELFAFNEKVDSLQSVLQNKNIEAIVKANTYNELGLIYFDDGSYPESLENFSQALHIYKEQQDQFAIARTFKNIGNIYSEISDFDNSMKYYLDALVISEQIENLELIASLNFELGKLFIKLGEFDSALVKFKKSMAFYESDTPKYNSYLVTNYANIGISYGSVMELDSALMFFNKAFARYPKTDYTNRGGVLNNIGAIKYKQHQYDSAMYYYKSAVNSFTISENVEGMGISYFNIAQTYLITEKTDSARLFFEKSIPFLEDGGALYYLFNCYKQLSDFSEKNGDIENSLRYYKLYAETKDSIINAETLNEVSSLQMQYNMRKVEHKISLLEKDNEIKQIKEYLLIGLLVLIAIISVLLVISLRVKINNNRLNQKLLAREKQQLENELNYKNRELETFALQIVRKNEFLNDLKTQIKRISGDKDKLKEISIDISQNIYLEKDREEFQSHLEKIHQAFFFKLEQRFPDLTTNDKRLCSLLAIDMSTKDIAAILNISPDSVKKSRYRLRKKLNLETEDNLSEGLKKL
jgi:tetratricopeptide (TPR) repeat protein